MIASRGKLPYVQRIALCRGGHSFRGWVRVAGRKLFSACYPTEREAYEAHLRMAKQAAPPLADGVTLDEACEFVLEEVRAKRTAGSLRWYQGHLDSVRRLIPGATPLHRITAAQVEQFVRDRLADCAKRPVLDPRSGAVLQAGRRRGPADRAVRPPWTSVRQVDGPRADRPAMDDPAALDLFSLFAL